MIEGFILSNKFRKIIFDAFASGETHIDRVIKKYRLIPSVAHRVVNEFLDEEILEKHENRYQLTAKGEKLKLSLQ